MVGRALPCLAHLVAILHSQLRSMRPNGPFCECPAVAHNGT